MRRNWTSGDGAPAISRTRICWRTTRTAAVATLSSCVSSGPASSTRARYSYWPTALGVIRNVVRLRMPSSPSTTRWLPIGSQPPSLIRCSRTTVASASLSPRASTTTPRVIGSRTKTTGLASISASRMFRGPFVGPGGDRVDRDVLPDRRLRGAERVLARVRPAVGRQHDARDRLAAMRRQHASDRVAQRRDRPLRLDVVELPRLRRIRRALPGRRVEVVDVELPAPRQRLQPGSQDLLHQLQPRRLPQPLDRRLPAGGLQLHVRRQGHGARVVRVRVGEPHALRVVQDDRQVRRHGLALRRDQHRLEQHRRDRQQDEPAQADQQDPLAPRQVAALPAIEPPEQVRDRDRRDDQHDRAGAPRPGRELEPGVAARRGAGRPIDPQEHLPESSHGRSYYDGKNVGQAFQPDV